MGPDCSSRSSFIRLVLITLLTISSNGGSSALTILQRLLLIIDVSSSMFCFFLFAVLVGVSYSETSSSITASSGFKSFYPGNSS